MTLSSAGLLTIADDFMMKDGGTIGSASATTAMTVASDGIVTFVDDIKIKDGGTIGSASDPDAIAIASDGIVTFSQKVVIDGGIDVDNFHFDGATIALSSGDMVLDGAGDIILDADGADIIFKDGGTAIGTFTNSSSDFVIAASVQDKDILFKGDDGGSAITALTLDMSAAGAATFNAGVTSGAGLLIADDGTIGSASDTDAITIAANGNTTFSQDVTVSGNLTVSGTTTQVNTVTMNAENAVVFEGATADSHETTLTIIDPTADRTQRLINQSGFIPLLEATTTTVITSTPAELNLLDGSSANSVVNSKAVIYGSSGELAGELSTAAQPNVTSLGTLSALTVDDVAINGKVITMTGSASDTAVFTADTNGTLSIVTTDDAAAAANITITADGTFEADGTTITLDSSGDIDLNASGGDVFFKSDSTTFGSATNTSGDLIIKSGTTTALTFSGANVTSAGVVTATGFTIGSAAITEAELEILDGAGVTTAELNMLDGSAKSTSSITVVDADAFIVIDGTTTKQIPASDIKTYAGGVSSADVTSTATSLAIALG